MRLPGAFFFNQMICRRREDGSLQPIAIPAAALNRAQVDELIALLNRGTHAASTLEALRTAHSVLSDVLACERLVCRTSRTSY